MLISSHEVSQIPAVKWIHCYRFDGQGIQCAQTIPDLYLFIEMI